MVINMNTSIICDYFSACESSGEIKRIKKTSNKTFVGQVVGCKRKDGYLVMRFENKLELCHRVAFFIYHGYLPKEIDHIDGDRSNNSKLNLRAVTRSVNNTNQAMKSNNTSGVCGVYWMKNISKWAAEINVNKKKIRLGYFSDINDAAKARNDAERKYGFTKRHGAN